MRNALDHIRCLFLAVAVVLAFAGTAQAGLIGKTLAETGIAELDWPFGEDFKETLPYGEHKKVARYYLAEAGSHEVRLPISPELGRPEHQEFRWVSFEEAEAMLPPRLAAVLEWARAAITGN